jgi:hypothetical protein
MLTLNPLRLVFDGRRLRFVKESLCSRYGKMNKR